MEKGTVLLERGEGASAKVKLGKKRRQQLKKRLDLERERLVKVEELMGVKKEKEKLMMEEELKRGKEEKKKLVDEEYSNSKRMIGDGDCWGSTTLSQETRAKIDSIIQKIEVAIVTKKRLDLERERLVKVEELKGVKKEKEKLVMEEELKIGFKKEKKKLVDEEDSNSKRMIGDGDCWGSTTLSQETRTKIDSKLQKIEGFDPAVKDGNHYLGFMSPRDLHFKKLVLAEVLAKGPYSNKTTVISKVIQAKIDTNEEKIRDSQGFDADVMADVPDYDGIRLMTPIHFYHEQTNLLSYSNTAISTYNTNLEVVQLVKATYNIGRYLREYYITFTAKPKDEGGDATPWEILKGYSPEHPLYQARVAKSLLHDALDVKLFRPAPHTFPYLPIPPPW